jgi:hypothetical protein
MLSAARAEPRDVRASRNIPRKLLPARRRQGVLTGTRPLPLIQALCGENSLKLHGKGRRLGIFRLRRQLPAVVPPSLKMTERRLFVRFSVQETNSLPICPAT